jgi:hypothetical protein
VAVALFVVDTIGLVAELVRLPVVVGVEVELEAVEAGAADAVEAQTTADGRLVTPEDLQML